MSAEIYNEGRVVGYSAYEIYVKQHLSEDPDTPVASEREWLASSIAMGSSMLLQLPRLMPKPSNANDVDVDEIHSCIDVFLPTNSVLAAANTIIASFFDDNVNNSDWDDACTTANCALVSMTGGTINQSTLSNGKWATRVIDYGQNISNVEGTKKSPDDGANNSDKIYPQSLADWNDNQKAKLRSYMRIVDGIVIHPGTWSASGFVSGIDANHPPAKDFKPDFSGSGTSNPHPRIRLHIKGPLGYTYDAKNKEWKTTECPWVLFTGFTIRSVLAGTVGTDGSTNTPSYKDGDFLGPGVFPWANKIVFSVPTSYIVYFESSAYKRKLTADGNKNRVVSDTPIIDMKSGSENRSITPVSGSSIGTSIDAIESTVLENYYTGTKDGSTALSSNTLACIAKLYNKGTASNVTNKLKSGRVSDVVSDFVTLGDGTAVLTVYQKKSIYPPALYGTFVDDKGQEYLHPIDNVAPGSVKMFHEDDGTLMRDYEDTFPGTTSMNISSDGTVEVLDPSSTDGSKVPTGNILTQAINYDSPGTPNSTSGTTNRKSTNTEIKQHLTAIQTGKKQSAVLSLDKGGSLRTGLKGVQTEYPSSNQLVVSQNPSNYITLDTNNANDNITWSALLTALANDEGVDILAQRLKAAKNSLIRKNGSSAGPYIEFGPNSSPIRLYITNTKPEESGVPVGSIGIGWGFSYE